MERVYIYSGANGEYSVAGKEWSEGESSFLRDQLYYADGESLQRDSLGQKWYVFDLPDDTYNEVVGTLTESGYTIIQLGQRATNLLDGIVTTGRIMSRYFQDSMPKAGVVVFVVPRENDQPTDEYITGFAEGNSVEMINNLDDNDVITLTRDHAWLIDGGGGYGVVFEI